jgi:hypothetical protein
MTGAVSPSTIATLSSGEFVGIVADDPDRKMQLKAFHATIVKEAGGDPASIELPIVHQVTAEMVEDNFRRIKQEVKKLIDNEMQRIVSNPQLEGTVVKGN